MGSLILIFTVIAAITTQIKDVYSKPLTQNDVDRVLQTLQVLLKQDNSNKQTHDQDEKLDEDEDDNEQYGSLKNYEVQDLLHLSKGDKHRHEKVRHKPKHHDLSSDRLGQQILEQLLHKNQDKSHKQRQYRVKPKLKKQQHLPNDLLASLGLGEDRQNQLDLVRNDDGNDKRVDLGDLSDYSKVYVVLNSDTVRKSKNKSKLNGFLSNLLSASADNQRAEKKDRHYNGFVLKDFEARRAARDDDMSDADYKPKRSRGDRGGGSGGRTAIPYMGHRGDIYEKGS